MKIGMILDSHFPPDPRVENEALYLIDQGHEVFLFCLDYTGKKKSEETYKNIHVIRIKPPKIIYKLSALAYTFPFYHDYLRPIIKDFIIKNKIDTIHIHDIQVARAVFDANKTLGKSITLDLHENRPEIMKYYAHTNTFTGKMWISPKKWKKYEADFIKKSDHVIVVTEEARDYYLSYIDINPDKFKVVPNSVRKEFYNNIEFKTEITEKLKGGFNLLYIGDTGIRRGLLTAIEAIPDLINKIPDIKLVIVGRNKTDNILKEAVTKLQLEDHVLFEGWQSPDTFASYIESSDLGISPLHRNIHHDTTYANKIFMYMAFGKPIVVSDTTTQKNLVNRYNCGEIFEAKNTKDFSDKVLSLFENREKYEKQSENAAEAIEQELNWDKQAVELNEIYK
ncbi:glycosyltransferase family 4 protein [Mangrovivirga sp. M17]|uniref:Glycosyltransferase family 4 protein n=1 Tax=Mangrovivirga halotolerans TaxID=2993936 RepID=A0ABT3RQ88_9BACT|nr:glycosyltransferase family 4 protein [Mangrovivirga halotolerans]MCX2743503.1 glycosyltransferase family 4 protein [Mangrovivirga halotolerans]